MMPSSIVTDLDDSGSLIVGQTVLAGLADQRHGRRASAQLPPLARGRATTPWAGTNAVGYHVANVVIHALGGAGAGLGGGAADVRSSAWRGARRVRQNAPYLVAFFVALLVAVHPLQTESVTYAVQRADSG